MWTARFFGLLIVGGGALYVAWSAYFVMRGVPVWPFALGLPVVYLALPLLATCLWMLLAWLLRAKPPAEVRLTFGQCWRLFADEFLSIARSPARMALYRWLMPEPPPAPAALPVLLLHGVACNSGVWTGFRRFLESRGLGPVYALSYGPPLASIEQFAPQVAAKIDEIRGATGAGQVVLVTHSMGGLVARVYLREYGGAGVRRLVTVGAPHHGSMHAWLMNATPLVEMRPGSPFLIRLNDSAERAAGVPLVSLWSWHDSMVTPQTSARLDWADNIVITGVAHNALLNDRGVWDLVAAEVEKARS